MFVRITPKSKRAKQRVHDYGAVMFCAEKRPDKILCFSIRGQFGKEQWKGWFTSSEVSYREVDMKVYKPRAEDDEEPKYYIPRLDAVGIEADKDTLLEDGHTIRELEAIEGVPLVGVYLDESQDYPLVFRETEVVSI